MSRAELVQWLERRAAEDRALRRIAQAAEFAHRHPEQAKAACDAWLPPTKII